MKITLKIDQETEVTTLRCKMGVRYWEDAVVNGDNEDNESPKIPFGGGSQWVIDIDLASGRISNWPSGVTASTHYKVCDDGVYELLDADGVSVARIDGYVPNMLAPNGEGYGDYVILDIGPDGVIDGWRVDMSCFDGEDE